MIATISNLAFFFLILFLFSRFIIKVSVILVERRLLAEAVEFFKRAPRICFIKKKLRLAWITKVPTNSFNINKQKGTLTMYLKSKTQDRCWSGKLYR